MVTLFISTRLYANMTAYNRRCPDVAGASAHGFYCETVINVSLTLCHAVDESWSNTGSVIFSKA